MDYGFGNFQKLTLGENDFNLASGGEVIVPAGAGEDSLTTEDTPADNQINRQYLFSGTPVGTAVMLATQEQDNSIFVNSEKKYEGRTGFHCRKIHNPLLSDRRSRRTALHPADPLDA